MSVVVCYGKLVPRYLLTRDAFQMHSTRFESFLILIEIAVCSE